MLKNHFVGQNRFVDYLLVRLQIYRIHGLDQSWWLSIFDNIRPNLILTLSLFHQSLSSAAIWQAPIIKWEWVRFHINLGSIYTHDWWKRPSGQIYDHMALFIDLSQAMSATRSKPMHWIFTIQHPSGLSSWQSIIGFGSKKDFRSNVWGWLKPGAVRIWRWCGCCCCWTYRPTGARLMCNGHGGGEGWWMSGPLDFYNYYALLLLLYRPPSSSVL